MHLQVFIQAWRHLGRGRRLRKSAWTGSCVSIAKSSRCNLVRDTDQFRDPYAKTPNEEEGNPYEGMSADEIDFETFDPIKYYRLPADPWHIVCRWKKDGKSVNLDFFQNVNLI